MISFDEDISSNSISPPLSGEEKSIIYETLSFDRMRQNIKSYKDKKQFCDFKIIVGNREFDVHRVIIANISDFFNGMLNQDFKESKEGEVTLHDIHPEALDSIINFAYIGSIKIHEDNVHDLLSAASFLQVREVEDECIKFFINQLSHHNCIDFLKFSSQYEDKKLYNPIFEYLLDQFKFIILNKSFLEIDSDLMKDVISDDRLICTEERIFESVILWTRANPEERMICMHEIMEHVKFVQMSPRYLCEVVLKNDVMINCSHSKAIVLKAFEYLTHWKDYPIEDEFHPYYGQEYKIKPRLINPSKGRIYASGGWNSRATANFEEYNPDDNSWTVLDPMVTPRFGIGAGIMDKTLYFFGGHNGKAYLDCITRYCLVKDRWLGEFTGKSRKLPLRMKTCRTSVSVAVVDDNFYLIGGEYDKKSLNDVCKFNPFTQEWSECAPMKQARLGAGVAVIKDKIYVVGGSSPNDSQEKFVDTIEVYDTTKNEWSHCVDMRMPRKHAGCVVYDGKIYIAGGRNSSNPSTNFDTAEVFDPRRKVWSDFPSMTKKRSGLGLLCLNHCLYALGGFDGELYHRSVECFDLKRKENGSWEPKRNMIEGRLGGGFVAYTGAE